MLSFASKTEEMDLGELFLFLGLCVPGILATGVLCFLTSFIKIDWPRLVARAGLVSIAIAPSEDHHRSLWPAIWGCSQQITRDWVLVDDMGSGYAACIR